jgi:hypothetical protein
MSVGVVIRVVRLRNVCWAGLVVYMGKQENTQFWWASFLCSEHFWDRDRHSRVIQGYFRYTQGLFNDAVNSSDYTALNDGTMSE